MLTLQIWGLCSAILICTWWEQDPVYFLKHGHIIRYTTKALKQFAKNVWCNVTLFSRKWCSAPSIIWLQDTYYPHLKLLLGLFIVVKLLVSFCNNLLVCTKMFFRDSLFLKPIFGGSAHPGMCLTINQFFKIMFLMNKAQGVKSSWTGFWISVVEKMHFFLDGWNWAKPPLCVLTGFPPPLVRDQAGGRNQSVASRLLSTIS